MKGQEVSFLKGENNILKDYKVLVNGAGPSANEDSHQSLEIPIKAVDPNM
jgi:hypothetical protein